MSESNENHTTDTDSNFGDVSSLDISNDDLLSETYSFTNPFIGHDLSLEDLEWEDLQPNTDYTYISCIPNQRYLELVCSSDNDETFNTESAKQYCRSKIISKETNESDRTYYQRKLITLGYFCPEAPAPMQKIPSRSRR